MNLGAGNIENACAFNKLFLLTQTLISIEANNYKFDGIYSTSGDGVSLDLVEVARELRSSSSAIRATD